MATKKTTAKSATAGKPAAKKRAPARKRAAPKPVFKVGYVALIGRPNTGKSTLLNALLGQKVAIVSDKPQTTRISILGIKTTDKGQTVFVDNPGIHKPLHTLNKRMMNFVYSALETADVVCLLIDATEKFGHGDEYVLETLRRVKTPVFLLINKVDITRKDKVLPIIDRYKDLFPFKEIVPISALKGVNLDVLEKLITEALPEAPKLYSDEEISDQSEKFLFAEIVREKILKYVTEELPFVTAVYIESIEKKEQSDWKKPGETRPVTHIRASIFVEKDNHHRPPRLARQADRHRGPPGDRRVHRPQGLPRAPGEGAGGLARLRGRPRPHRRPKGVGKWGHDTFLLKWDRVPDFPFLLRYVFPYLSLRSPDLTTFLSNAII
jgi:GTP-binding protein Era